MKNAVSRRKLYTTTGIKQPYEDFYSKALTHWSTISEIPHALEAFYSLARMPKTDQFVWHYVFQETLSAHNRWAEQNVNAHGIDHLISFLQCMCVAMRSVGDCFFSCNNGVQPIYKLKSKKNTNQAVDLIIYTATPEFRSVFWNDYLPFCIATVLRGNDIPVSKIEMDGAH